MHIGIDYGSKLAGTTVIAFADEQGLHLLQSEKKKDADKMILHFIKDQEGVNRVYIDAPLSLPQALINGQGSNYHYRACDKALNAMSPMFLGGLTARAMQPRDQITDRVMCFEVYPGGLVRHKVALKAHYAKKEKEKITSFMKVLSSSLPLPIQDEVSNWHQVDALLAWWIGWKHIRNEHETFGDEKEGLIYI